MKGENGNGPRRIAAYLAFVTVILFIISGYGITKYQTVEKLTFGLLTKALSFKIHGYLIYPLLVFLLIHLYYSCPIFGVFRKNGKD